MIQLKAGDVRQEGDEVRQFGIGSVDWVASGFGGVCAINGPIEDGPWKSVRLLSHPILASDLMHLEFRRP